MSKYVYNTLSEAVNDLTRRGYKDDFISTEEGIKGLICKKLFQPEQLKIIEVYRFEGMTDPADSSELFGIIADDGSKGTLVMSYGANNDQVAEMIKRIPLVGEEYEQ